MFGQLLAVADAGFQITGLPEIYEFTFGRLPIEELTPAWFMSVLHGYNRLAKRVFDMVIALVGIVAALPLVPAIVVLVKRTPGPLLYGQQRMGENSKTFTMLKFRSMRHDAETNGEARWAAERDGRVIPGGRLLRLLRLDELPQLAPGSKLACARALTQSTLAEELGVGGCDEDELYGALDWLGKRQGQIERRLARRHLAVGELALYDLSSSYFEGRSCPLAALGYSRDGRRGTLQIVYGLLTNRVGTPVGVDVFDGATHDHQTIPAQLAKLKGRFGLSELVLVADRGMVTHANIDALREADGMEWITALKAPQVKRLARIGAFQPSLFDQLNLAEISAEEYPGERLVVCRNPLVAAERARKREALLEATERKLAPIAERVARGTLRDAGEIGLAVGQVIKRHRVKKHFLLEIADGRFGFARKGEQIAEEAALDGIYILRTSLSADQLAAPDVVRAYKQLKQVERDFRALKGPELEIRPIHHRLEHRVRAHVFLCMLALYVEWHLRHAWRELTFADEQPPEQTDPVAKASRSAAANRKAATKKTAARQPAHNLRGLLAEIALQTRNTIRLAGSPTTFTKLTKPTPLQARALELVDTITPK